MEEKRVSLVLGSGGARGMAHIGVIRWLEEHNYKIESISGCSMGALVGGFYAAGKLDIFTKWIIEVDGIDLLKLLDLSGSGGLVSGNKIVDKMQELLGRNYLIEELPIKFTAVATDIDAEKEIWINKGPMLDAIRASTSLPLFFAPYVLNGRSLVDGGTLNPVPIAPTFHDSTDMIIAVNLGGEMLPKFDLQIIEENKTYYSKIKAYISKISLPESIVEEDGMYAVANKAFESMQSTIARMKLSAYPPDVEIIIPKNLCDTFDFDKVEEVIEYGYNMCDKTFAKK
ncbi:MAG: patatin-like phospholipase family protein [Sulfurimonas sp.]|uniref:patatin-like phospholipase family protein n=1 Tax=Sulfurimonas sp. TaxID=2022749 RepID=UPI00262E648D|nr:patatin-like phospholipase family protein [Sulfurimonas sp.]MCW8896053.1 patatin-like phospholipase family protein [Sulfurimonas sp.]MCW8954985.1 patatin-like phospholipase family protein [Sulfurimonas sp.]